MALSRVISKAGFSSDWEQEYQFFECSDTVQVKRLRKQLADRKQRETILELQASELERERDSLHALWLSERERHALVQKAMMSSVTAAGLGLSARLAKQSCCKSVQHVNEASLPFAGL
jgi:hypothetical protein